MLFALLLLLSSTRSCNINPNADSISVDHQLYFNFDYCIIAWLDGKQPVVGISSDNLRSNIDVTLILWNTSPPEDLSNTMVAFRLLVRLPTY